MFIISASSLHGGLFSCEFVTGYCELIDGKLRILPLKRSAFVSTGRQEHHYPGIDFGPSRALSSRWKILSSAAHFVRSPRLPFQVVRTANSAFALRANSRPHFLFASYSSFNS